MTFYGHTPETPKEKPLRSFEYVTQSGGTQTVEAHYTQFMPEHVTFWLETEAEFDTLVLAEAQQRLQPPQRTRRHQRRSSMKEIPFVIRVASVLIVAYGIFMFYIGFRAATLGLPWDSIAAFAAGLIAIGFAAGPYIMQQRGKL
jgi:hypothetical protein